MSNSSDVLQKLQLPPDIDRLYSTIRGLRLKNFRVFEDTELTLSPITTFVGINGSGKSSLARALTLLSWASSHGGLRSMISQSGGGAPLFRHGANELAVEIGYNILNSKHEKHGTLDHSVTLRREKKVADGYKVWKESVEVYDKDDHLTAWSESINKKEGTAAKRSDLLSLRGNIVDSDVSSGIPPEEIRIPTSELPSLSWLDLRFAREFVTVYDPITSYVRVDPTTPSFFRLDGRSSGWLSNEAGAFWDYLYRLCQSGTSSATRRSKERWLSNVREILPWVENVIAERDVSGTIRLIIQENQGAKLHPIHVSDGTLMLLGRLAVLESAASVIIVDEPETHLHPDAVNSLMKIYRSRVNDSDSPIKQVIITTQSPLVVRNCKPDEIRVVQRKGVTAEVLQVSDDPDEFHTQLAASGMTLDEAWLSNIFGGTTSQF